MDFGIIAALSSNPEITKAAITGLATSLGKVVGESWLNKFGLGGGKLLDAAGNLTQKGKDLLVPIAHKYIKSYTDRHGQLKVLGMEKSISLNSVYCQVNFDPEVIETFQTVDLQEQAFRSRDIESFRDFKKEGYQSGIKIANNRYCLMVLGGPGMGKTTFLRKIGLEALKQGKGEYQHLCIPVFLELRRYRWKESEKINLVDKIVEEFKTCNSPEYGTCVERLLENGKLLILLDGLDEVPTELLGQMTIAIRDLVDRYPKNHFIASCRIANYKTFQNFGRFTDVAIANLDKQQIQLFIENWFKSHSKPEWGQECWKKLNMDDHKAAWELAQTPLLLTLICILFLKKGEFPSKRATLYKKAFSTLLEEWDTSKEIDRQKLYQKLDNSSKEVMLAEIAHSNFITDNLFFQQGEISQQIKQILQEMPEMKDENINGKDVLKSIEEQHGLLINRDEDIYSFSHLTIQEFLTAKQIVENNLDIKQLVKEQLCNKRWREVFLLIAGLRKADDLLLAIEEQTRTYIDIPGLKNLLVRVDEVIGTHSEDIQLFRKRALLIANAINNTIAFMCNTSAHVKTSAYANAYAIANMNIKPSTSANAIAIIVRHIDYIKTSSRVKANINKKDNNEAKETSNKKPEVNATEEVYENVIEYFIEYAGWAKEHKIYKRPDLELPAIVNELESLGTQIPQIEEPKERHQEFAQQLIKMLLTAFHLTPEMVDLSKQELHSLDNYLYSTRLLIECEHAAVRRTTEVWNQIEDRLLRKSRKQN